MPLITSWWSPPQYYFRYSVDTRSPSSGRDATSAFEPHVPAWAAKGCLILETCNTRRAFHLSQHFIMASSLTYSPLPLSHLFTMLFLGLLLSLSVVYAKPNDDPLDNIATTKPTALCENCGDSKPDSFLPVETLYGVNVSVHHVVIFDS
jgi:hypothetical protein